MGVLACGSQVARTSLAVRFPSCRSRSGIWAVKSRFSRHLQAAARASSTEPAVLDDPIRPNSWMNTSHSLSAGVTGHISSSNSGDTLQQGTQVLPGSQQQSMLNVHTPFLAFFGFLAAMAVCATSSDWYLDAACFGGVWAVLWAACCSFKPSVQTIVLLNLLPVLHLCGALGTYNWELGNLSWDILVHISSGFIGTLLFAAILSDITAAQQASSRTAAAITASSSTTPAYIQSSTGKSIATQITTEAPSGTKAMAWQLLQLAVLLIAGTSLIEVVEGLGGQVAGCGDIPAGCRGLLYRFTSLH